jgi:uncharacterized membrane protein YjjP (DUF1212 family)
MSIYQSASLVLASARDLFCNGQSTNEVVSAAERIGRKLGLNVELRVRWGDLHLQLAGDEPRVVPSVAAVPVGLDMNRVVAATHVVDDVVAGRLSPAVANDALAAISRSAPAPTWLFALAAGAAAVSLAVIYGVQHILSVVLIFLSAAAGAVLRRWLARQSTNALIQPFCAALLAGIIGAIAVKLEPTSSLRLVAICPCMVLVPGPHILNGAFDLIHGRIHLGAARLLFAAMIVLAITAGLLIGLALPGVSLPVEAPGRAVPLWQDVIAAGVAVACYSIFYSTPVRLLAFPVAAGMAAHALRTAGMTNLGLDVATGAFVACAVVGFVLAPLARRQHLPFAALAFASVVSMMPGVYFFRVASGLVQIAHGGAAAAHLVPETIGGAMTAFMIVMAMTIGLVLSKSIVDQLAERRGRV